MDVNNAGQNTINLNAYNSNLSNYTETNTEVAVPQVHGTQEVQDAQPQGEQSLDENNDKKQDCDKKELDKALKMINNFLKDEHTHAEYAFHKEFKNTLMIKIIDDNTKNVILEIPPQKILDMVASMCERCGLIDKKA